MMLTAATLMALAMVTLGQMHAARLLIVLPRHTAAPWGAWALEIILVNQTIYLDIQTLYILLLPVLILAVRSFREWARINREFRRLFSAAPAIPLDKPGVYPGIRGRAGTKIGLFVRSPRVGGYVNAAWRIGEGCRDFAACPRVGSE